MSPARSSTLTVRTKSPKSFYLESDALVLHIKLEFRRRKPWYNWKRNQKRIYPHYNVCDRNADFKTELNNVPFLNIFLMNHSLSLSVNNLSNKNASYFPESSSDTSDNELNFSLGGTPSLIPVQSRTTHGSLGTTYGLQATGSDPRTQQPVAGFDWTSSADLK